MAKIVSGVAIAAAAVVFAPMAQVYASTPSPLTPAQASAEASALPATSSRASSPDTARVVSTKVSNNGRLVRVKVRWHTKLLKMRNHRDCFTIRIVAMRKHHSDVKILSQIKRHKVQGRTLNVEFRLSAKKARVLRAAPDTIISVSQKHGNDGDRKFEYVSVATKHLGAHHSTRTVTGSIPDTRSAPSTRSIVVCFTIMPSSNASSVNPTEALAQLQNVDAEGADLSNADLSNTDFTGSDFTGATLTGAKLDSTNLTGATLTEAVTGAHSGTPSALPSGWQLVNGKLVFG